MKWSDVTDPEHDVTLPFTRMYLGPMDYTPGAMRNAAGRRRFAPIFEAPMSLGTRAHQLALYVVFESPLQMLADSPSAYEAEPEVMEFLGPVPSVWDETRVLQAKLGDYVARGPPQGRRLVDRRDHRLDRARPGARPLVPARGPLRARRLRGRR